MNPTWSPKSEMPWPIQKRRNAVSRSSEASGSALQRVAEADDPGRVARRVEQACVVPRRAVEETHAGAEEERHDEQVELVERVGLEELAREVGAADEEDVRIGCRVEQRKRSGDGAGDEAH